MPPAQLRLSPEQQDALCRVAAAAMKASGEVLSDLILHTVELGEPQLSGATWEELASQVSEPVVVVRVEYTAGVEGSNLLVMRPSDAARVAAMMMGEDPPQDDNLDELHLSAVSEAMNQMIGASATALSHLFGRAITISPPSTVLKPLAPDGMPLLPGGEEGTELVQIAFPIRISDDVSSPIESRILHLFPGDFARSLSDEYLALKHQPVAAGVASANPGPAKAAGAPATGGGEASTRPAARPASPAPAAASSASVGSAWEPEPLEAAPPEPEDRISFELLKRITVPVTVRLGQAQLSLQDVLSLTRGAIVPLDAADGQPVDVLISGTLVARGEVVVVRERFGVRITELIRPDLLPGSAEA